MIDDKSVVVVYLNDPREKYWGRLEALSMVGVYLRGMDLSMVLEWAREIARGEETTIGLSTVFFPLARVEKVFLDEESGAARSMRTEFLQITGRDVEEYLWGSTTPVAPPEGTWPRDPEPSS